MAGVQTGSLQGELKQMRPLQVGRDARKGEDGRAVSVTGKSKMSKEQSPFSNPRALRSADVRTGRRGWGLNAGGLGPAAEELLVPLAAGGCNAHQGSARLLGEGLERRRAHPSPELPLWSCCRRRRPTVWVGWRLLPPSIRTGLDKQWLKRLLCPCVVSFYIFYSGGFCMLSWV